MSGMLNEPLRNAIFLLYQLLLAILTNVDEHICGRFIRDLFLYNFHLFSIVLHYVGGSSVVIVESPCLLH